MSRKKKKQIYSGTNKKQRPLSIFVLGGIGWCRGAPVFLSFVRLLWGGFLSLESSCLGLSMRQGSMWHLLKLDDVGRWFWLLKKESSQQNHEAKLPETRLLLTKAHGGGPNIRAFGASFGGFLWSSEYDHSIWGHHQRVSVLGWKGHHPWCLRSHPENWSWKLINGFDLVGRWLPLFYEMLFSTPSA